MRTFHSLSAKVLALQGNRGRKNSEFGSRVVYEDAENDGYLPMDEMAKKEFVRGVAF